MTFNPCLDGEHLKCSGDIFDLSAADGISVRHYDCPCSCHRDPFGTPYRLKWTTEETSNLSVKSQIADLVSQHTVSHAPPLVENSEIMDYPEVLGIPFMDQRCFHV